MSLSPRIAIAFYSIVAGAAGGAVLGAGATTASRTLLSMGSDPSTVVYGAGAAGVVVALVVGWITSRGLGEAWRRALVSAVAAGCAGLIEFGAFLTDMFVPQIFLVILVIVLATIALFAARQAQRPRAADGPPVGGAPR